MSSVYLVGRPLSRRERVGVGSVWGPRPHTPPVPHPADGPPSNSSSATTSSNNTQHWGRRTSLGHVTSTSKTLHIVNTISSTDDITWWSGRVQHRHPACSEEREESSAQSAAQMTSHGGQGEFNTDTQRVVRREKNPQHNQQHR